MRIYSYTAAFLLFAGSWAALPIHAQSPFQSCVEHTGSNATIVIPASADPHIDGRRLKAGDEIAVIMPSGQCAGRVVWDGQNTALTAWGDNPMTEETDGIVTGTPFDISVWDASQSTEYNKANSVVEVVLKTGATHLEGRSVFAPDAIYVVETLRVFPMNTADLEEDAR